MKPIITAKKLNFTYNAGKANEFRALVSVSFEIYPEDFVIIFGPSGCGKSTLLNVMAGLETPNNGEIEVLGQNLMTMSPKESADYHRHKIGVVYQSYNLIKSLSVLDNVALPQLFVNVGKRERNKKARVLLERFEISKQAKRIPTELSGGQQQRVGIARSIVNDPVVILADEPTGNLDSVSAKNVMHLMSDLCEKEKKTIVLVTHNPEQLEFADRVFYMKDGVIIKEVINDKHEKIPEKGGIPKSAADKIKDIMRTYRDLTTEQMNILIMPYKAKIFTHHFITTRTMEETEVFEDAMRRKLLGTISKTEFLEILDRSSADNGVGFDKRTAKKIADEIEVTLDMGRFVYKKYRQRKNLQGKHDKITEDEKAKYLVTHLLKKAYYNNYHKLDERQINRMRDAIRDRLSGSYGKTDLYGFLDMPFRKGGVGLNSRAAQLATEEMELIMILGFGMVKSLETRTKPKNEENILEKESSQITEPVVIKEIKIKEEPGLDLDNLEARAKELKDRQMSEAENKSQLDNK
ncbi:MAG: ABC transporter ATP-binding protein [Candidatus Magasanikbacteria bacterium]|nr:ABC transporter ATP-binding protein [Candidatus Magasanikbacteria bacterium]